MSAPANAQADVIRAPYPGGLPPYPNALPNAADIGGAAAEPRLVSFTTSDEPNEVLDYYTTTGQLAGLRLLSRSSAGPVATLAFLNADEAIRVTAIGSPAGTRVQIAAGTR